MPRRALALAAIACACAAAKADDALPWLAVDGSYRVRAEGLDGPFRAGASGSDQILAQRLLLELRADFDAFYAGLEIEDSRAAWDDAGTPIGTDDVNALEPLQAYVGMRRQGVLVAGDTLDLRAGRFTMDLGSRRLAARNRFRNTLNAFTGVRARWQRRDTRMQAFVTLPISRRPRSVAELRDNEQAFDHESTDDIFWGLFVEQDDWRGPIDAELYLLGLHRDDRASRRDLYTAGFRLRTPPAVNRWDIALEAAVQLGTSRDPVVQGDRDLDHRAGLLQLQAGRTLDAAWRPRLVWTLDYASGDSDPDDGDSNRFDTLYGARRFDFGPTGIYGALARSNLLSPGLRVEFRPVARTEGFVGYRAAWLASDRDQLATAGLRDVSGSAGQFIGHQLEFRLRYQPRAFELLRLEAGGAWLRHGRFLEEAPAAGSTGDTVYGYLQATLGF